ncbi:MAG TPA: helix-turn-helix domain-containing protein [Trebonia sp.]
MTEARDPDRRWPAPRGGSTRARIVAAAADPFARHGAAATSLEDVRRAAGVSGSQITHYFGGKQGLDASPLSRRDAA